MPRQRHNSLFHFAKEQPMDKAESTTFVNLGIAHTKLGESQQAIADFDRAIALAPENVNYLDKKREGLEHLGEKKKI